MLYILKLTKVFPVIVLIAISHQSANAFEVKGEAISTTFCAQGHCETDTCSDEDIYEVYLENSTITRIVVVNSGKSVQGTSFGGLQADNAVYTIVYNDKTLIARKDNSGKSIPNMQQVITAIGKTGIIDGFEMVIIGEDFIHTSRSSADYFVIYYYKRKALL